MICLSKILLFSQKKRRITFFLKLPVFVLCVICFSCVWWVVKSSNFPKWWVWSLSVTIYHKHLLPLSVVVVWSTWNPRHLDGVLFFALGLTPYRKIYVLKRNWSPPCLSGCVRPSCILFERTVRYVLRTFDVLAQPQRLNLNTNKGGRNSSGVNKYQKLISLAGIKIAASLSVKSHKDF